MSNYYVSSFFWSVINKVASAVLNFLSVPLLLHYLGLNNYGILSLATATNAYLYMMDLGMMNGSIKYFSQWHAEGEKKLMERVAGTSLTFYGIIGIINALVLASIACWGEHLFNISYEEFMLLRVSLLILATFSIFNWIAAVFYQLLVSAGKMSFVQQTMTVQNIIKVAIIYVAIYTKLSLNEYFFILTLITASILLPYIYKSKQICLITSLRPRFYWKDFQVVFVYSLAIFCWSFFSMTASQSRPIILGMFCEEPTKVLADYRIIEVFPLFIISIGGMLSGILLPKASVIMSSNDDKQKCKFLYEGTAITTILCACLCCPIMLCAKDLLELYVGPEYTYLVPWLQLWCFSFLFWLHSTPACSMILSLGDMRPLVYSSGISCVISIIINILLCKYFEVGSAVIGYFVHLVLSIGFQYIYYYNNRLHVSRSRMLLVFFKPTLLALITTGAVYAIMHFFSFQIEGKLLNIIKMLSISAVWLILYITFLWSTGNFPGQIKKMLQSDKR